MTAVNVLKYAREAAGLSQSQLAARSGVNVRMIQKYEQGDRDINGAAAITVYRLAVALNVPLDRLLNIE